MTLHCIIVKVEIEIDEGTCRGQQLNKREGADTSVRGAGKSPHEGYRLELYIFITHKYNFDHNKLQKKYCVEPLRRNAHSTVCLILN